MKFVNNNVNNFLPNIFHIIDYISFLSFLINVKKNI